MMYIQYINLLDKSFRVKNVFLDKQEQFRVLDDISTCMLNL